MTVQLGRPGTGASSGVRAGPDVEYRDRALHRVRRADHAGIRSRTLGRYQEQLTSRLAVLVAQGDAPTVADFGRHDLGALDCARRFLLRPYQERLIPEDIVRHVGQYRLDNDPAPLPRRTCRRSWPASTRTPPRACATAY